MPEIIQNWLGTTLGVILDMSPEKFGRNTKDGKLLAQILYNYGVIPVHVLNSVKESKNYYECYNNLNILKPWMKYIGVIQDDSTLQKMASGEGSAAISVFYAVYLNLERKDRLHYLSAQKARRMSGDSCQKFKVDWVPETCVSTEPGDLASDLANSFADKRDLVEWHKSKCKQIVEIIKRTKKKFHKVVQKKPALGPPISKHATSQPLDKRQIEAEETRENITDFEKKHPQQNPDLNYSELIELQNMYEMQPCIAPNMLEAQNIVSSIKRRKKGDYYARSFQQKMQQSLLDEQWKEIVEKQDQDFESTVCANLLKQSHYEKQMAKKLYLIRNQKKIMAENRKKIDCLKMDQCQKEYDEVVQNNLELRGEFWEEEEFEKERIAELHRRLYDEKVRLRQAMLKLESQRILEALVDIAIRISEVRELIGCEVPKSFMKDLKELFFKNLPIFDLVDHYEELYENGTQSIGLNLEEGPEESGDVYLPNEEYERMKRDEKNRQSVLDECDFNDYLQLTGPWMVELLFPNGSDEEVKHLVLGYIVHKLLGVKYPMPNAPERVDIKPMTPTSVVQGLTDETGMEMLMDLMEACRVLVVRVDDAINFVLSAYKEEMSEVKDIDLVFIRLTEESLRRSNSNGKDKEVKRKLQLLKKGSTDKSDTEEEVGQLDKETQTPRVIPEEDSKLSHNAELGKLAFEALGAGDPVPDSIISSAVTAYVVSRQSDYDGWVLLNYPLFYSQASELEYALTGLRILPIIDDMETVEEMEDFTYRGPWGDSFSTDDFGHCRFSRLVPKPEILSSTIFTMPKTYFNTFIKLIKNPATPQRRSLDIEEIGPMEKYYSDVQVLLKFEYQNINFQTIKNLGKLILGVHLVDSEAWEVAQKSSVEIFGNAVLDLNEKWDPYRRNTRDAAGGPRKPSMEASRSHEVEFFGETGDQDEELKSTTSEITPSPPKPGDPTWEWATGPQPESFLLILASLWENMEAVYIEDFKNLFFCLRVHRANVIEYTGFVRKLIQSFMKMPDQKQQVLKDFQQMFNEIDEDLRPDVDIKCELHVRVSELEQALMSMADEKKTNTMKDVMKVAQDGWVPDEMANLVNVFLSALQLETDRCIDSCQVIMDYYTTLQQKPPDEKQLPKVVVPKIQIQDRKYSVVSSASYKTTSSSTPRNSDFKRTSKTLSDQISKLPQDKVSKTRSINDRRRRSSESAVSGAADVIMGILTNLKLPEDGLTPFHTFFTDNLQISANEVKAIVESCLFEAKKSDKAALSNARMTKNNKKTSDTKVATSNDGLFIEWTTALENELSRFNFRSQIILARGIFELNEFLTKILNTLSSLSEEVTEMYLKEIRSISECCQVFKCGIEEEIQILPFLELRQDEFFVCMDDINFPDKEEKEMNLIDEDERKKFRFSIEQLALLFQKLQWVAPDGEIIKRSFVYIIEDLRMLKPEVENCSCFPDVWNDIEPDDVTTIMNEVYQDLEIVNWKDFIIYALELPMPTEPEILSVRRAFRKIDPLVTELVTRENYDTVTFWFENIYDQPVSDCDQEKERILQAKNLLYRMYQVDELQANYSALLLAFCKDENPVMGFVKALSLAMGKIVNLSEEIFSPDSIPGEVEDFNYEMFDVTDKESIKKPTCCPTSSTELTIKCIPKEKIVRCECKPSLREASIEESTEEENLLDLEEGEAEDFFQVDSKLYRGSSMVSNVPFNILSSLLKASFPSLPQLTILLDCEQTFQETLSSIYDSLDSYNDCVEIQKLLNHNFIHRLLHSTNKFKFVKLKSVLLSVAKLRPPMPRALCVKAKPNVSYCLRK